MSSGIISTKKPQTPAHTGSDFTELAAIVRGSGLMRRRYGYYWTKLIAVPVVLAAAVLAFIWIGDTWWQLFTAVGFAILFTQIAMLGHDAAHRQIFRVGSLERLDLADHRRPVRRHELRLVAAQAHASSCEPEQDRRRSRHRPAGDLVHARAGARRRGRRSRSGSSRTRASSSSRSSCSRGSRCTLRAFGGSSSREKLRASLGRDRRSSPLRLAGFVTLVFLVLSPGIAFVFLAVQLGIFGVYMGMVFAPNHKGMPLVPKDAKLDFLTPSGADEPQRSRHPRPGRRDGRPELPDRAPPVPVDAAAAPAARGADGADVLREPRRALHASPGSWSRTAS